MKYSNLDVEHAWDSIEHYRHANIRAEVTQVSRSGMSRQIRFFAASLDSNGKPCIDEITCLLARITGHPMGKQGLKISGCGMDMRFAVISNFNYLAASHDIAKANPSLSWDTEDGRKIIGLSKDDRIYDNYFFDANRL